MVQTRSYNDTRVNIDRYFAIFDQTETLPPQPLPRRSQSGFWPANSPESTTEADPDAETDAETDGPAATGDGKVFSLKPYIRDPASPPLGQPDLTKASRALQELQTQLEVLPQSAAVPLSMRFPNPLPDPTAATGLKSLNPWNRRLRMLLPVTATLLSLSLGLRYTQISPLSCAQVPGCQGTVHALSAMGERLSAWLSGPGHSAASSGDPVGAAARVSGSEPLAYVEALAQGYQAAHLTQTAHTPEQWHTVIEHWQAAIAQLETLTTSDEAQDKVAAKLTEYRRNLAYAQGETDPFRQAVNVAEQAGILTQTAATSADWNAVISHWRFALRLMADVPDDSPHLGVAQVKIAEYASNLTYARQKLKTSSEES